MSLKRKRAIAVEPEMVNVHMVYGDLFGIEFLRNAAMNVVETLFFRAKLRGRCEFRYKGTRFTIVRRKDLTYFVQEKPEETSKMDSI